MTAGPRTDPLPQASFGNAAALRAAPVAKAARAAFSVEANIDYGLGLKAAGTAAKTVPASGRGKCPPALEKGPLPLNTFGNKDPFKGKIASVERIVGPKATGETTHIIINHEGKMPYWEGQSYGVIPPVSWSHSLQPTELLPFKGQNFLDATSHAS